MKKFTFLIVFLLISSNSMAGFESNIKLRHTNITSTTNIEVGINLVNFPCLIPFLGEPNQAVFKNGNQIELVVIAASAMLCSPIPIDNPPYQYYSIGNFREGVYDLRVRVVSNTPFFEPFADTGFVYGTINGIQVNPVIIPSLGFFSMVLLLIGLFLITNYNMKRKENRTRSIKLTFFLVLILFTNNVFAEKLFHIILSEGEGVPLVDAIIAESLISPPPVQPLLSSFENYRPNRIQYLITMRPTGDLASFVSEHPKWTLSRLYRYLVLSYDDSVQEAQVKTALQQDPFIKGVVFISDDLVPTIASKPINTNNYAKKTNIGRTAKGITNSYLNDLGIPSAWELSEGSGYIGIVDTGTELNHPAFKTFDASGNYLGGNILGGFYSFDTGQNDLNVDEKQPVALVVGQESCEDPNNIGFAIPRFAGHGTHVTGVIGANNAVSPENGICKNCGLSIMKYWRNTTCGTYQGQPAFFAPFPDYERLDNVANSMNILITLGVGIMNYSGGVPDRIVEFCNTSPTPLDEQYHVFCEILTLAKHRNILLVTSAGNNRGNLQFPASDIRTVAAGGIRSDGLFWNESPLLLGNGDFDYTDNSDATNCPFSTPGSPNNSECGSTKSFLVPGNKIDVVTQAKDLHSTFYTGAEWNPTIGCTDSDDNVIDDGYGNCTGTSMSAPLTAAILQLMRSTLPLLPNGDYDPNNLVGLINVLNHTATSSTGSGSHDPYYGYGMPNARKALEVLLGKSNGVQLKNRLTPMFVMFSTGFNDHVYTSFPQLATAYLTIDSNFFIPDVNTSRVNEFTDFWYDHNDQEAGSIPIQFPPPRASFYVFTTNNNPFTGVKDMVPLRRMDKTVTGNRNDTYAVSNAEIKTFHNNGYNLDGIEGYILPKCSPQPDCAIPSGSIALYRDETDDMNHKLVPIEQDFPVPDNAVLLGYVYLNEDNDGDGLINGQEIILGTNTDNADTDGDTVPDGVEYPPAGVPYSDPRISDIIFKDGFE